MRHRASVLTIGLASASLGLATLAGGAAQASPSGSFSVTPVVTGLNNPRGVAVDRAGDLYVAQAGQYLGTASKLEGSSNTGSVSKYSHGRLEWSTFFTSLYDTTHGPEVLGPAGLSTVGNNCGESTDDEHGKRRARASGCDVMMIMSESQAGNPGVSQLGNLYRLNGATGAPHVVSNVGDQMWDWTGDHANLVPAYPDGSAQFPDSNPYAVLVTGSTSGGHDEWHSQHAGRARTFVADAGANTVSEIMPNGTARVIAFLPNAKFSDAIPTCITQGPDGALYVGTLALADNTIASGASAVYRINPNYHGSPTAPGSSKVWATGLTDVTGCTFDRAGNFWATEMFYQGPGPALVPPTAAPGDIAKIPFRHPSSVTHYGWSSTGTAFPVPGGIAAARNGDLYVSIGSDSPVPNSGAVVRVSFGS